MEPPRASTEDSWKFKEYECLSLRNSGTGYLYSITKRKKATFE